jgi:hypothetical protein
LACLRIREWRLTVTAELTRIAVTAFKEFGVRLLTEPESWAPAGDLGRLYRFTSRVVTSDFFH